MGQTLLNIGLVFTLIGSIQGIKYGQPSTKPTQEVDFTCPEEFGYYPHPSDCTQYYVCVFGGALLESCTGGLMYSNELQTCDWPRNVGCQNGTLISSNNIEINPVALATNTRTRSTTESSYVYKPIQIDNYSQLTQVIKNTDNSQSNNNNGRSGRSYEGSIPNYKQEIYEKNVPIGSNPHGRKKRQTLLNLLDKLRGITRPSLHFHGNNEKRSNQYNSMLYPPSYYVKPSYGTIIHPLDLRTTTTPRPFQIHNYLGFSTTNQPVTVTFRSNPFNQNYYSNHGNGLVNGNGLLNKVNIPIVLKQSNLQSTTSKSIHDFPVPNNNKVSYHSNKYSSQFSNLVTGYLPASTNPSIATQNRIKNDYNYYDYDYQDVTTTTRRTTTRRTTLRTTRKPFININFDKSVNGRSKYTSNNEASYIQNQTPATDYEGQRYAANVPVNNTASYVYENSNSNSNPDNDESYYVYDDSAQTYEDDVDYKNSYYNQRQPSQPTATSTTTKRPITTTTPKPKTRSRTSSSSSSNSNRNRPTLKPKNQLDLKAQPVRDVYVDLPSRPAPYYETPAVNSPATKCRKDTCVLPDCNCGGKDIPNGLRPEETPQIVMLTFDDSVNDLNKNLYRDLFEKGRKNPNGCPISATFYVSHEWTDYSQVQNLAADGHEIASHSVSHSFGESFSSKKWEKEINGQREILAAYGGVKLSEVRGMRAPFLAIGGNNMFKMLHDANFTYDSSMPVYENRPPSWPYTLDYKIFHDCMIPPCPTKSYPGVWEVPMVMWQDLKGGRCSMGDACSNPPTAEGVYQMLAKNFERHYTTNRAPFGLYYHAAWFTTAHHKEGFEAFLDTLVSMDDVWLVGSHTAIEWTRNPTPINKLNNFAPFNTCHGNQQNRPSRCNHPKVCNLWHKSGVRYMKTCQTCPQQYPWTGNTGVPFTI